MSKIISAEYTTGDTPLSVKGLTEEQGLEMLVPFIGSVPVKLETGTVGPVCQYWNASNESWVTDGLILKKIRCFNYSDDSHPSTTATTRWCYDGQLTCVATHLSAFAAKTDAVPSYNSVDPFSDYTSLVTLMNNYMTLSWVCSLYFFYFLALYLGSRTDKLAVRRLRRLHYFGYTKDAAEEEDDPMVDRPGEGYFDKMKRPMSHEMPDPKPDPKPNPNPNLSPNPNPNPNPQSLLALGCVWSSDTDTQYTKPSRGSIPEKKIILLP